jgi:hypothetical protein
MKKDKCIYKAIEFVNEADLLLGKALKVLYGDCPLASDHIVNAQYQCMDAITHMQTRSLKKIKKSVK